jgi:L-amino acid N-acyltransferase YncA
MTVTRPTLRIREAMPEDAGALASIYAHHVQHGTGTFEEEPPTRDAMAARLNGIVARGWPWLVAERDGSAIGYAYAGIFRDRSAYRFSAEDSVYVHPHHVGAGIGQALLDALLDAAGAAGFQRMFAVIGDSANVASIKLHEKAGFRHCGQLARAGFKFGRYLDVVFMQRELAERL